MPKLRITQSRFERRLLNLEKNLIFIISHNKALIGKLNSILNDCEKMYLEVGTLYIIHSLEHSIPLICLNIIKNFENFIPWNMISKNAINIFGGIKS